MWTIISASVAGTSHARLGTPCQDAHATLSLDGWALAAVADGLGSAPCSRDGAATAVDTAIAFLRTAIETATPAVLDLEAMLARVGEAFRAAREELVSLAEASGEPLAHYGTTLIVVALAAGGVAIGHLGDGAVVAAHADGSIETLSTPHSGEFLNEVLPLTAPTALAELRLTARAASFHRVALLSDGLQQLALRLPSGEPFVPFFAPLFAAVGPALDPASGSAQLAAFLDSERVCERTEDDKTLVVIGACAAVPPLAGNSP